jgi:hypothetical protein
MFSTGKHEAKSMNGVYKTIYYATSDDFHAKLGNPAFAAIHKPFSEGKARQ